MTVVSDRHHPGLFQAADGGKLFARDRIARLVDDGSFVEDGMFANALAVGLPADGVITGSATVDGRRVAVLRPIGSRPRWVSRGEFVHRFSGRQADAALAEDLRELAPDTTDDLS